MNNLLNEIHHMDALELLSLIPDDSIDMVLTSPPYDNLRDYKGFAFPFEDIAQETFRVLKSGGVLVWVVGDATINGSETGTSFRQALYFMDCGFRLHDTMIYEAIGTGAKGSNYSYWQAFEYMFILSKGKPKSINRIADVKNKDVGKSASGRFANNESAHKILDVGIRTNIWRYLVGFTNKSDSTGHPAPFPEKLAHDHIYTWSNEGDIVLDYFMGSGTTAKMAQSLNRQYIGCDISEEYCELARNRVQNANPYIASIMPDGSKQLSLFEVTP